MELEWIDIAIVVGYIVAIVLIGYTLSKKAFKNLDTYFLGGKTIPWYILGVSNASGMFDITGTMWTVSICFIYGLKSAWIPWLWPVWNQIFLMIFLAVWLRRSNVMTGAEWLKTRFGNGRGATLSHIIVVVFALVSVIGFIAYGFEGIGKFAVTFLPWDLSTDVLGFEISSAKMYAIIIMAATALYVVKGGLYSVVMTELLQFIIMVVACCLVGGIAIYTVSPDQINAVIPNGWKELFFGWELDLDWSNLIPAVNDKINTDGYTMFGALMMMMLFKGVLVSIAGPVPSYDMQRILATRTPKEAAKMSGFVSLALFFPRYLMIAGLTVLALVFLSPELRAMGGDIDFEQILPYALQNFIPVGFKGLLLAGLISAFMSTFAANVNAGPAYIVNDIYKRFFNDKAPDKQYIRMSYWASFLVVVVGIFFGFFVDSIDSIMKWLVGALFGGYTAANLLKWLWWRFNGFGYFWGMLVGLIASLVMPLAFPDLSPIYAFPFIFLAALTASVAGSLLTEPDDEEVLMDFYLKVRPWGFWGPVREKLKVRRPNVKANTDFGRDMFNCFVGTAWQMTLVVMPIFLVIREYTPMLIALAVFLVCTYLLKVLWYDKLQDWPDDVAEEQKEKIGEAATQNA
ncbi:sodium:solute symporter (plasmid) [Fulvitalea axinellae]|uniref:Sodium:solute symporter n=1 Tax=Fulvitalea axinellae TaxID=1182444 RepID=A0AAU9CXQ4_9BACT|nr:sodium:solute symporter [Fulvitalea axinellae]